MQATHAIENILKAEMEVNTQELNELMDDFDISQILRLGVRPTCPHTARTQTRSAGLLRV